MVHFRKQATFIIVLAGLVVFGFIVLSLIGKEYEHKVQVINSQANELTSFQNNRILTKVDSSQQLHMKSKAKQKIGKIEKQKNVHSQNQNREIKTTIKTQQLQKKKENPQFHQNPSNQNQEKQIINKIQPVTGKQLSTESNQQKSIKSKQAQSIQWPEQNVLYHIYSAVNPRMVLDVYKPTQEYHELILYQWEKQQNQMFYFQKVHDNFYHIINAETKQFMKKSRKIIQKTGVNKVQFSQKSQDNTLWEVVPAQNNAKNSFYILNEQKLALDLNEGYAGNGAQIIVYQWSKNYNQLWFLRKNQLQFQIHGQGTKIGQYQIQQKLSELLYQVMSTPDSYNECITLEELKRQLTDKQLHLPFWLQKPQLYLFVTDEMPPQISYNQYHNQKKTLEKTQLKSLQDEKENSKSQAKSDLRKETPKVDFKPQYLAVQCAKNHTIAYIWYGEKEMPQQYKDLLEKCKQNVKLLTEKDFLFYVEKWNIDEPIYAIEVDDYIIRQRINLLKLLYLYYESGIYADFDTQINEQCFSDVYSDEVIWTSRLDENVNQEFVVPIQEIIVPQESFIFVRTKEHPQILRMLKQEIMEHNQRGGQRWKQCKYRQCLIINCQRHYRDNTYKKGFD